MLERFLGRPPEGYRPTEQTLQLYQKGIVGMAAAVQELGPPQVLTLGHSARAMWKDIEHLSLGAGLKLPSHLGLVGSDSDLWYRDDPEIFLDRYRLTVPTGTLILEDFARNGIKIMALDKLFEKAGIDINYLLMTSTWRSRFMFKLKHITVQSVLGRDRKLIKYLKSRGRPSEPMDEPMSFM